MKSVLAGLTCFLFSFQAVAQLNLIKGFGWSFGQTTMPSYEMIDTVDNVVDLERVDRSAYFLALNYIIRQNVYEINNNNSLALDIRPTLGFYFPKEKKANDRIFVYTGAEFNPRLLLQLPIMLHYNFGVLSTSETENEHGLGVGVGVNYQRIFDAEHYNPDYNFFDRHQLFTGDHSLWQPVISLAYRRWGSNSFCYEYAFKYMFSSEEVRNVQYARNTLLFSVNLYFNY